MNKINVEPVFHNYDEEALEEPVPDDNSFLKPIAEQEGPIDEDVEISEEGSRPNESNIEYPPCLPVDNDYLRTLDVHH